MTSRDLADALAGLAARSPRRTSTRSTTCTAPPSTTPTARWSWHRTEEDRCDAVVRSYVVDIVGPTGAAWRSAARRRAGAGGPRGPLRRDDQRGDPGRSTTRVRAPRGDVRQRRVRGRRGEPRRPRGPARATGATGGARCSAATASGRVWRRMPGQPPDREYSLYDEARGRQRPLAAAGTDAGRPHASPAGAAPGRQPRCRSCGRRRVDSRQHAARQHTRGVAPPPPPPHRHHHHDPRRHEQCRRRPRSRRRPPGGRARRAADAAQRPRTARSRRGHAGRRRRGALRARPRADPRCRRHPVGDDVRPRATWAAGIEVGDEDADGEVLDELGWARGEPQRPACCEGGMSVTTPVGDTIADRPGHPSRARRGRRVRRRCGCPSGGGGGA